MIFVTVGTWHRGFDRLLRGVHDLLEQGEIGEPVYAQVGHSSFRSPLMENAEFLDANAFSEAVVRCRIVVAHAGVGSICKALEAKKPIVVVPRKSSLGEADNDHQFVTARQFESEGKLLVATEVEALASKLKEAEEFVPAVEAANNGILEEVGRFIDQVAANKALRKRRLRA